MNNIVQGFRRIKKNMNQLFKTLAHPCFAGRHRAESSATELSSYSSSIDPEDENKKVKDVHRKGCLSEFKDLSPPLRAKNTLKIGPDGAMPPNAIRWIDDKLVDLNTNVCQLLGQGLYGVVYKAKVKDVEVAVKIFNASYRQECVEWECRVMAHLSPSERVPVVYGIAHITKPHFLRNEKRLSLVMEYIEGASLYTLLKDEDWQKSMEPHHWLYLARNMVEALERIQSYKIIHNDLKSQNIIVKKEHQIIIIDFGSAAYKKGNIYQIPQKYWKNFKHYAPEVLCGQRTNFSSDIYSLGVMLKKIFHLAEIAENAFYVVANSCCVENQEDRPTAKQVLNRLTDVMRKFSLKNLRCEEILQVDS